MKREGFISVTLRPGERAPSVPCYLDCLLGASRAAGQIDGGPVDRALTHWGGGFRAATVYHSRSHLGLVGEQAANFDDYEEALGMSRSFSVEIADGSATLDAINALRELPFVESAAAQQLASVPFTADLEEPPRTRPITREEALAPHRRVHAAEALEMEPGDERVTVAVVDTGVALGHPEFRRKLLAGYDCVDLGMGWVSRDVQLVGDSRGSDFAPRDEVFHGSHVAGVLGAQGWRIPRGVAGLSLILPIRVLAAALLEAKQKLMGIGCLPNINAGMKVAIDMGANVINMSFGTAESALDEHDPRPHAEIVDYAEHYGCVLVAAAGNSGKEERYYPAALPQVIAVGSADEGGRRSRFSTYGDHVALCAPGERIVSAGRTGYRLSSGTSHAAPFVAGAAALILARARRSGRQLKPGDVKRLLMESARPLGSGGFSPETGSGLLDMRAALRKFDETSAGAAVAPRQEIEAGKESGR
jgi:subtilisin family serine protease